MKKSSRFDVRLENKIRTELSGYQKIVLYGTGKMAEYILPFLEEQGLSQFIYAIVDRDESDMIGKTFLGYEVKKFSQIYKTADVIVIVSERYWREISTRLERLMLLYGIETPIIAIYDLSPKAVRENKDDDYKKYVEYIENRRGNQDKFIPESYIPYERKEDDSKVIAYYLPQYYPMEINDRFHGRGFTEWTNSSQSIPLYVGHEQPHIPYDVGYYSLTTPEVIQRQIELAKRYGIYGFCFHYYWFSGKKMMEKPIEMLLEHKELDIPFCLNWATENWTTVWDGSQFDVIYKQESLKEDPENFMKDILPYFKDERYIKINGKPLFIIYTLCMFEPDYAQNMIQIFRDFAKKNGFPDLYILISNYHNYTGEDLAYNGADGIVEFPPSFMYESCEEYVPEGYVNPYFAGSVLDFAQFVKDRKYLWEYETDNVFRSALASFDNTARKPRWGGTIYHGANPDLYKKWLQDILELNKQIHSGDEDIVFVNSWNEWAEGSHLEPDIRNGYGYLEATCNAIYAARGIDTTHIEKKAQAVLDSGKAPVFYVMCIESMGDVVACEPIARYLKEKYPDAKVNWIIKAAYSEIVKYNPNIDAVIETDCLAKAIEIADNTKEGIIVDCHYNERRCTKTNQVHKNMINPQINERTYFYYGSLLENFCMAAGLPPLTEQPVFHLKDIKNPFGGQKYVVIHCKSAEVSKDWAYSRWTIVAKKLIECGYNIIEIGMEPMLALSDEKYIDFTSERDLQFIATIIKDAELFLGVDSGFAHVANCFEKKSLILLGQYKNFEQPMPYTGYLKEHKEEFLLYPRRGTVKEISVENVLQRVQELIE